MTNAGDRTLEAEFEKLKRDLQEVFFGRPTKQGRDRVLALQGRYTLALAIFAEFLERNGCNKDIADKFTELGAAILERGMYGTTADVLRGAKAGGDPPDGLALWTRRAMVVAGLECMLNAKKMPLNEAAEYIAGKYPVFNRLKRRPNRRLSTSIVSWRRTIRLGKDIPAIKEILEHQHKVLEGDPAVMFVRGEQLLAEAAEDTTRAAF
jgi:hypothetical protein